jgi:hypothetical protein
MSASPAIRVLVAIDAELDASLRDMRHDFARAQMHDIWARWFVFSCSMSVQRRSHVRCRSSCRRTTMSSGQGAAAGGGDAGCVPSAEEGGVPPGDTSGAESPSVSEGAVCRRSGGADVPHTTTRTEHTKARAAIEVARIADAHGLTHQRDRASRWRGEGDIRPATRPRPVRGQGYWTASTRQSRSRRGSFDRSAVTSSTVAAPRRSGFVLDSRVGPERRGGFVSRAAAGGGLVLPPWPRARAGAGSLPGSMRS